MSIAVFEYVFEIKPAGLRWRLTSQSLVSDIDFNTFTQAERRARWLAVRQEVRGFAALIRIFAASGDLVGTWRGEPYAPEPCKDEMRRAA